MNLRSIASMLMVVTITFLVACTPGTGTETAEPVDTLTPVPPTVTEAATPQPAVVPPPTSTPVEAMQIPDRPLSQTGPWLLVHEVGGIWALNPDGSGLTKIIPWSVEAMGPNSVFLAPAPQDPLVAILEYDTSLFTFPILTILSLPMGEILYSTRLLSDSIEATLSDGETYMQAGDIFATVGPHNRPVWSPDGSMLAFNAAIDGDSSDLYVYDVQTGVRTRLTSGPTQSLEPAWSPDGSTIVQGGALQTSWESSGSGYQMDTVWAVRADGSGVRRLFTSEIWGFENTVGWPSDTTVLFDTLESLCPYTNLRTIDVETGDTQTHWPYGYDGRAFDPSTNTVLISIQDRNRPMLECAPTEAPGLYLVDLDEGTSQSIELDSASVEGIQFAPSPGFFFVHTSEGLLTIQPNGQLKQYPAPERGYKPLAIAPSGNRWLFIDKQDNLWMGNDSGDLTSVYEGGAEAATWSPDGESFFFLTEEDTLSLYVAHAPDFSPTHITVEIPYTRFGNNLIWVSP